MNYVSNTRVQEEKTNNAKTNISSATTAEDISASKNHVSLSSLLCEYPTILTLSLVDNIQPTIEFYNRTGYVHLDENGNRKKHSERESSENGSKRNQPMAIVRARYIASSLYNCLLPRWYYLTERHNSKNETSLKDDALTLPPLHILALSNDNTFCKSLQINNNEYARYKVKVIPRLKFSTQFENWIKTGRPIDGV